MKIGENTFVSLTYALNVDGNLVDSATEERPLEFVYGAGFLLPEFEKSIKDLKQGEKFEFTLEPAEGYGEIVEEAVVDLPMDIFMVDGAVEEGLLAVGNQIPMSTQDGQHMMGVVKAVSDEAVTMDFNHPMAGKTLNFSGMVVGVREATEEDMQPGFGGGCSPQSCEDCGDDSCGDGNSSCCC